MIRENEREFKTKNRIKLFPKIRLKNIFQVLKNLSVEKKIEHKEIM